MAVAIQNFFTQLKTNSIRTQNMYEVQIDSGIASVNEVFGGNNQNTVTMYAEGFALPERSQDFTDVSFKGYPIPVPTIMKMGQDHSMTIRADVAGNFRRGFLLWEAAVCDPRVSGAAGGYFEGDRRPHPESTITVTLLGNDMQKPIETYVIAGVRIQSVGALTMSNNDAGIATFEVNFKSLYWYIKDVQADQLNSDFIINGYDAPTPLAEGEKIVQI